jgi:hypothetical protein
MSLQLKRLAVLLPVVLLVSMVVQAEWQLSHSKTWHFAIQGYDPRDLLRGHYMNFRLDISTDNAIESCSISDPSCCYCLAPGPGFEAEARLATCETATRTCAAYVRTQPLHSFSRFYIPEQGRLEMESALREAAVEDRAHLAVAVSATGEPMIEALLIDGIPIQAEPGIETSQPGDDGRE